MEIRTTYVCDGAIYCGFKPEGVTVLEERSVLYPQQGYELINITNGERFSSVWLKDGDVQSNYIEVKLPKLEPENEEIPEEIE